MQADYASNSESDLSEDSQLASWTEARIISHLAKVAVGGSPIRLFVGRQRALISGQLRALVVYP